jgi:hypothetical protein
MRILLITIFTITASIILVDAVEKRHTKVYNDYWADSGNNDRNFFDERTFGVNLKNKIHPCKVVKNGEFRQIINSNIACKGNHCVNDVFKCNKDSNVDCYHVEHIIDINGREFPTCTDCKDIFANKVMAWGRWNSALGGLAHRYYNDSISEKEEVYGIDMVARVRRQIEICKAAFPDNNNPYDPNCDTESVCMCDSDSDCGCDCEYDDKLVPNINNDDVLMLLYIVIGLMTILIILGVVSYIQKCSQNKKNNGYVKESLELGQDML